MADSPDHKTARPLPTLGGVEPVEASFVRPAEEAKNDRWIFFAGVLVSLAASFLVWTLELLLGPERDPVAALRRQP